MIYLDNAATSFPKPEEVYKRADWVLRNIGGNPGRASHRMALEASRVIFEAREGLATLLGVSDAARIAFTKNATEAINTALKGLIKPGDHIVTTAFEHNSVARTIRRLEKEGVIVTRVSGATPGIVTATEIGAAITKETKIVCVTHASNVFGAIVPVADIGRLCAEKGVLFMIDAAQTAGAMPMNIDEMAVDIVAGTGHKALFGLQGTGFLYLREGVEPEALVDGGTGEIDSDLEIPDRLESGTMNMPGIGGLGAGVEFLLETGVDKVRAHERALIENILEGLGKIKGVTIIGPEGAEGRVSLVSFTMAGIDALSAGTLLDTEHEMMVRTGTHCAPDAHRVAGTFPDGTIRVSPGFFNTLGEIEGFIKAVETINKGL